MKNFRRVTALLLVLCMCLSFASATEITEEHSHGIVSEKESTSSGIQELTVSGTTEAEPPVANETTTHTKNPMQVATTPARITNGRAVPTMNTATTMVIGSIITAPNYTPIKTGHTFKGWYTASTGGSLYNTVTVSAARTFYAQFTPASYTVTFDPGEGELETTTKSVTYGDTYGELPEPTRAGYSFFAWFTEEDGGTQITPETKVDITADQTLYASWIKSTIFSVTVPATLPIIVDQYGQVHTVHASPAAASAPKQGTSKTPAPINGTTHLVSGNAQSAQQSIQNQNQQHSQQATSQNAATAAPAQQEYRPAAHAEPVIHSANTPVSAGVPKAETGTMQPNSGTAGTGSFPEKDIYSAVRQAA